MRVISQDGTMDVPYDYFSLSIASGKYEDVEVAVIYCHNLSTPKGTKMAEYSSEEKAVKAMEMVRNKYLEYMSVRGGESPFTGAVTQPGIWVLPKVFRFPADDEVEV